MHKGNNYCLSDKIDKYTIYQFKPFPTFFGIKLCPYTAARILGFLL